MAEILYPSALTDNGHLIAAKSLTKETCRTQSYTCPHCGEKMTPVLGKIRVEHFRHLGTLCKRDYYLHACAEAAFMEEYQKCLAEGLPFYLELPVPAWCNRSCVLAKHNLCQERYNRKTVDLTLDYKRISKETRVKTGDSGYRRPDILLQTEDGKQSLWIEFYVTHAVDEIKQKTGRIIEIKIDSEKDIETFIRGHRIVQSDDKEHWVRLYNISTCVLDEPLEHRPHCDDFFLYEVQYGFGVHRIVDKVPSKNDGYLYQIALRLNWCGKHDDDGYIVHRISDEMLFKWCEDRYLERNQLIADAQIEQLVEYEFRAPEFKPSVEQRSTKWRNPGKKPVQTHEYAPVPARTTKAVNWIDLGLPSGILWADEDGCPEEFDDVCMLPSRANILELISVCEQKPVDDGLKIVGPNGNSIILTANQYRLSSHKYRDCVDMVSIYALVDNNYLHINEDDYSSRHQFRCVRLRK